jgi:lipoyl-dependent peroxiredoxin
MSQFGFSNANDKIILRTIKLCDTKDQSHRKEPDMPILYTTKASATGGRAGHAVSENGVLDVTLTVPKELGGDGATGTNPEQLFAAGYSACFLGALKFVAGQQKVKVPEDTTVTATVGIGPREDGKGFGIEVSLAVHVPGMDKAEVEKLAAAAHIVCPYSHAMRTSTEVAFTVV